MTIDMTQFYQVFFEEAGEHLAAMEGLLLELDVDAPDLETLNAIFRAAHSIKGGAGTFGFSDMAEVTHVLETLLDRLRKQELDPTVEMIDAFLQAGDVIREQLAAHQSGVEYEDPRAAEVCLRLETLAELEGGMEQGADQGGLGRGVEQTWTILVRLSDAGQLTAQDLDGLHGALADIGQVERLETPDRETCSWQLTTVSSRGAIEDILSFLCDPKGVEITPAGGAGGAMDGGPAAADEEGDGFGLFGGAPGGSQSESSSAGEGFGFFDGAPGAEQAVDQEREGYGLFGGSPGMGQVAEVARSDAADDARGFGFFSPSPGEPSEDQLSAAPPQGGSPPLKAVRAAGQKTQALAQKRPATADSSIRVSVEKVDQLINLVGELVITHAMLAESASDLDPVVWERVFSGLSNLERNSRDLQQAVMSIRMMPINFVFNRFPRVVRDTAGNLGKKVTLRLIGEDTELDKGLIERLADPLNHLVRNSIDHGIEMPEQRREAGKAETGEIVLRASHRGGSVVIEISDDGGGLNRERILAKASAQGISVPDNPSDKEVWQLIFQPGFSTAEKVTDISGRGVGMDVVRRNIEDMNGRVDIDSTPGLGTRITIRLPLTLAILDGLSVRMGEEIFILPLTAIQESIQPSKDQFKSVAGRGQVAWVNGEYLPLIVLHDVFDFGGRKIRPDEGILVIVDTSEGRAAVLVEELVAQHQVVIKSLETNYRKVEGVSGATIMGDGRVALILDVDALVRLNRKAA